MAPILTIDALAFRFPGAPAPVVEGLELTVNRNEFVAIVGGSGVGKSTLLRAIAGLITPDEGAIAIASPKEAGRRRRSIVFQDGRLLPWRSLADNIGFALKGLGLTREEQSARVSDVLALTQLTALADRYPHQLSGGQLQRGGIARALSVQPDLLLMDEPFSAVDAITRAALQDELLRIWQASSGAVLFVTHDIQEAVYLADRVIVLAGAPARITLDRHISAPRPRTRGDAALAAIADEISGAL